MKLQFRLDIFITSYKKRRSRRRDLPALRVMSDEGWYVVESIVARLEAELALVRLYEVVLDVGSLARGQSHRKGHGVGLARLTHNKVLEKERKQK